MCVINIFQEAAILNKMFFRYFKILTALMLVLVTHDYLWAVTVAGGKMILSREEQDIIAGANDRIEKYRKASAVINVVAENGSPVADASVEVEQENHEFLFGLNNSVIMQAVISSKKYGLTIPKQWTNKYNLSTRDIDNYLDKFHGFANYTALPVWWNLYENKKGIIDRELYNKELQSLKSKGIKVLAHNLVWNNRTPDWVPDNCDELSQALDRRVKDFISEYRGKFDYFLVVNEAANPFRPIFQKDKMTRCMKKVGKNEFVGRVFKTARGTAPDVKLMINEVSILEKQGFPELLASLKGLDGKPLFDIIGIQSHMHERLWPLDGVWKLCEGYSKFGVPIHFSEVTVLSGTPISGKAHGDRTNPEGERLQAEYAANLYTVLFSHPAVEGILWWNLTDLGAWKDAPAGLLRDDMSPKPAYNALIELVKKKWWTKLQIKTSDKGQADFRGFLGDYKVTVTPKNGKPKTFKIKLSKDGVRENKLTI